MMTARKRVRPLPTYRLAERHSTDHSSSDSSSEASSDFHSDASSDPSSRHSLLDHSSPDLYQYLCGVGLWLFADVEVDPRETSLRECVIVGVSDEPHLEQDSDPEVQAEIDECFAYADALRDRGIDARVVVETVDRDETETEFTYETLGDLVQRFHDHTQAIPDHRIQAIEGVQREQGHRIVGVESAVMALTERIAEWRDNQEA
ncbi:hypothetical protein Tco_0881600 [Tanacetum coccineum]